MQCKALVVDDEPLARVRMKSLLEAYASEIAVIGEAGSGVQCIDKVQELDPDVIFLDIQMPDMDAFEVLKNIGEDDMPLIIFTTAYENFALRAYEENTVDYLLKQVDPERWKSPSRNGASAFPMWRNSSRCRQTSRGKNSARCSTPARTTCSESR